MLRNNPAAVDIFHEEHITANRRGTMTDRQVRLIRWPLIIRVLLQWLILIAVYTGAIYAIMQLEVVITEQTLYGAVGAAALPVLWLLWITWRRIGSVSRREVASVAGNLTREIRKARNGKSFHHIVVEKRHFSVSQEAYEAFEEGTTYRVYYQPKLKVLLTAEVV